MASAEQINHTIDRYVEAFSTNDRDGFLALWAPDATLEDPVGSDVISGREGIGGFWDSVRSMASDIELRRSGSARIAASEAAWAMTAVLDVGGTIMGVEIIDVMSFDDEGRIRSLRAFWDPTEMAPHIG